MKVLRLLKTDCKLEHWFFFAGVVVVAADTVAPDLMMFLTLAGSLRNLFASLPLA